MSRTAWSVIGTVSADSNSSGDVAAEIPREARPSIRTTDARYRHTTTAVAIPMTGAAANIVPAAHNETSPPRIMGAKITQTHAPCPAATRRLATCRPAATSTTTPTTSGRYSTNRVWTAASRESTASGRYDPDRYQRRGADRALNVDDHGAEVQFAAGPTAVRCAA